MKCASCGGSLIHPEYGGLCSTFCRHCYATLSPEQKETYVNAVTHVWHAPHGQFSHYSRQLEMVVEDLSTVIHRRHFSHFSDEARA